MDRSSTSPRRRRAAPLLLPLAVLIPLIVGWHWRTFGWDDEHRNYPSRPTGYRQIVNTFGEPCNNAANYNTMRWLASDNGQTYRVDFHRKLGGMGTDMVSDQGGRSTNLDNDVFGHIQNAHLERWVKSGIWGYACRFISGTQSWSTHAWGIAVDVSSSFEGLDYNSDVNYHHAPIWRDHRWYWGRAFADPMHFQYADGY